MYVSYMIIFVCIIYVVIFIIFAVCSNGTFGLGCSQTCACDNDADCDPLTGECICRSGFTGPTCEQGIKISIFLSL